MTALLPRIKSRAVLEADALLWRRQTAALRRSPAPPAHKTALICNLMTTVASSKAEALYAAALRQRGYRVVVLLAGRSPIHEKLFAATGPTDFLYFDDFGTETDAAACRAQAQAALRGLTDGRGLFDFEEDGFRIGRNALSLAVRKLRVGSLDFSDPAHRAMIEDSLSTAFFAKHRAQALLDRLRPDFALFLERGYSPAGEVFDACLLRGVNVVQWLSAPQSDRFLFKRYSLATRDRHPLALADDTWQSLQQQPFDAQAEDRVLAKLTSHYADGAWFNRQQLQDGKRIFDKAETLRRLGVAPGRKVAVIFSHILYDATFFYGESLFPDYQTWLVETVRSAIANPQMDWVVKVHPVNVWRSRMDNQPMEQLEAAALRAEFGDLPAHVRLLPADTDVNTFSLFEAIDAGLTVRGTIGMELPCWGVPVVTAGSGRYSGNGFTLDPASVEEYSALLARLHEVPRLNVATVSLARRYAYGTFFGRPIPTDSFRIDYNTKGIGSRVLKQNTFVAEAVCSSGEFAKDMDLIADWMIKGSTNDLMLPFQVLGSQKR